MPDPSTRRTALAFLLSMLAAAGAVVAIGWFTDVRDAMRGALIAVATFALLPFAIMALGVFLALMLLALSLILALLSDGGGDVGGTEVAEPFVAGGLRLMGPYYRWLARQRHPTFWGVSAGVVLGALVLWSMIATVVLPAETRTDRCSTTSTAAGASHPITSAPSAPTPAPAPPTTSASPAPPASRA